MNQLLSSQLIKNSRPPLAAWAMGLATLGLVMSGCSCGKAPDEVIDQCTSALELPPTVKTDILFVIDNSGSMKEEQQKVVDQLQTFVESLANAPIKNDFQIGVVTTGVSQNAFTNCNHNRELCWLFPSESGKLQQGKSQTGSVIDVGDATILSNDANDPDFLNKVRRLVGQGTTGSGQEMGLEAARLAVSEPLISGSNQGLLRSGSRLLVIIVSDEDDCSDRHGCTDPALAVEGPCYGPCKVDADCPGPGYYCLLDPLHPENGRQCVYSACDTAGGRAMLEPVKNYVDFFQNLDDGTDSNHTREVFLAVIGAVNAKLAPERCVQGTDEAYGMAVRYKEAVDLMGGNAIIDSICNTDYATTLKKVADLVSAPQTINLAKAPPDGHLLIVDVTHADGKTIRCKMDPNNGFVFEPASGNSSARITFKGECRLRSSDRLELKVVCAG